MRNLIRVCVTATFVMLILPVWAPQLLAFPHRAKIGDHQIYSEVPIDASVTAAVAKADLLAAKSDLPTLNSQSIFLTRGGWRWRWLTQRGADGPFGLSRPVIETVVMNRSNPASDTVARASAVGGKRSLSGAMAHEFTHGAIRQHFGVLADLRYPMWVREGYCDFVAGSSTLSDAEAEALSKTDPRNPALAYWRGRHRVAAELNKNGGSVELLFGRNLLH